MSDQAQVTSLAAIESFRTHLILYLNKARPAVEEVGLEIQRTKSWLQSEQRSYWEKEFRRRSKELEQAQQEYFSAKLSHFRTDTAAHFMAVEKAKESLREAETKREALKRWSRELENRADPLVKQAEQLHTFLATDLAKAVAYLGSVLRTLDAYVATNPGVDIARSTGTMTTPSDTDGDAIRPSEELALPDVPKEGAIEGHRDEP